MPECSVIVRRSDELTPRELYAILKLRTDVFFLEQRVDEEELDWRDLESETVHYFTLDETGAATACLRVLRDAEPEHLDAHRIIGRVVTRADSRGQGIASRLLDAALADFGSEGMLLHAQQYIAPLYAKHGFVAFGDGYVEAGIPHVSMYRAPR